MEFGLLERGDELATLGELLQAARSGAGGLAAIEGPAGIGKTALLAASADQARDAGMRVLRAQGDALAMDSSFSVVRELLYPEVVRDDGSLLDGAAALTAPLFTSARRQARSHADAGSILHGLHWLVANLAERAPVALLIDDAQWIDPASGRFVTYLATRLDSIPVLMLVAVRSGEGTPPPGLSAARALRPSPLTEVATAELVRGILGPRADPELCQACHLATGGNPFYLRELATAIAVEGGHPTAEIAARVRALGVESVARSVLVRLARLGPAIERLAEAVAILGNEAPLRRAARLAGLDRAGAAVAADALRAADLLAPDRALSFAHPIVREAVLSEMPVSRAAELHSRAASLLATEGAASEQVAAHLLSAEPFEEQWVVDALRDAARNALAEGAPEAAVSYLRRALSEPPDPNDRLDVLVELGIAETRLPTTKFATLREALELAIEPERRAEIAVQLGGALASVMEIATVRTLLEEIAATAGRLEPDLGQHVEGLLLAAGLQDLEGTERLRPIVERHFARLDRGEDIHPVMLVSLAGADVAAGGPIGRPLELLHRALADARLFESPPVYGAACILLTYTDQLEDAGSAVDVALQLAQRLGSARAFMTVSVWRAMVDYRRGDLVAAEDHARRARALAEELGAPAFGLPTLIKILLERGLAEEAAQHLDGIDLHGPAVWSWQTAALLADAGRVKVALGELEQGLADMLEADRRMTASGWSLNVITNWVPTAALAAVRLGRDGEAREVAARELDAARSFGAQRRLGIALSVCGLLDPGPRGLALLHEAGRVLDASPARLEHARALINLGIGLRQRGERRQAREPLSHGLDLAVRCGGAALADQAREELHAAGARPHRDALTGAAALTPAELRTARMAVDGLTNKQIAQALFVSTKTVEAQLSQAYGKLSISGRAELAKALTS